MGQSLATQLCDTGKQLRRRSRLCSQDVIPVSLTCDVKARLRLTQRYDGVFFSQVYRTTVGNVWCNVNLSVRHGFRPLPHVLGLFGRRVDEHLLLLRSGHWTPSFCSFVYSKVFLTKVRNSLDSISSEIGYDNLISNFDASRRIQLPS